MESLCSIDGETLSRFRDGELSPAVHRRVEAHVPECGFCAARLERYGLADSVLSRAAIASASSARGRRVAASLSVAAALVASVATNALLTAKPRPVPPPALRLSAPPSETLSSFYEKVAPSPAHP
ncbi:MAG: hypothetical protein K1Y01_06805 [Vicinamibacteria bacterium]|nr:hypothetical protein [Vicinamibacteria bacterium]